jgi:hypothetical protein
MQGISTYARKAKLLPGYLLCRLLERTWPLYLSISRNRSSSKYLLGHLRYYRGGPGPVQRDEALLLYSLVRTVDPKTIVEFGFYKGHSAINFLRAMSSESKLYSFDIWDGSVQLARRIHDKRFKFFHKSQADFQWPDIDNLPVDLAFFDAAHDFDLNALTFTRIKPCLSERALIVVHDTGTYHVDFKGWETTVGYFLGSLPNAGYVHQPGERKFVNYIKSDVQGFAQVHLHSVSKLRCGLTLLQRDAGPLPL